MSQLSEVAGNRTSCRSANANHMRFILHTAAFWLMWRTQQVKILKATTPNITSEDHRRTLEPRPSTP
jgi:hypothetical protein